MIDYITVVPTEDEELKGHRYPFYACEVLTCDENAINELFTLKKIDLQLKAQLSATTLGNSKTQLSNTKTIVISAPKEDNGKAIDVVDINSYESIGKEEEEREEEEKKKKRRKGKQ